MRNLIFFVLIGAISCVAFKSNVKALTESHGQEVIEIGNPLKALPPEIEEEPSAEVEDDEKTAATSTTTVKTATEKEVKSSSIKKAIKDVDKIDGVTPDDDEESRIEKELADIYKDSADYKASDPDDQEKAVKSEKVDKPIGRSRSDFKFQPDTSNKADIERFRTSVDEIDCDRAKKLSVTEKFAPDPDGAAGVTANILLLTIVSLLTKICQ